MKGIIIVFRLPPRTNNTTLSKFCQKFYGQDTSSWSGKYRYHRQGLLDDMPHRKLIRGVLILRLEDAEMVKQFLGQYSAEVHIREIVLTDEDRRILGLLFK